MNLLITICARGGSKGLKNKNILPIKSVPLIGYSILCAEKIAKALPDSKVDIELSTDSKKIIDVAEQFNLRTQYLRPDFLASDSAGKVAAIEDLLNYSETSRNMRYDFILDLDVTSPLRTLDDILPALGILISHEEALNLVSVSRAHKSPYFNMLEIEDSGFARLVMARSEEILSRQAAPKVYDMNASFYIYRREFFDLAVKSAITTKTLAHEISHLCFDVDTKDDFLFMEYLITHNKLEFDL